MINKEEIKSQLIDGSNKILRKYNESFEVDHIAVLNSAGKVSFLGSVKIFNEDNVKKVKADIEKEFKDIGKLILRDRKVIPCCSLPYIQVSFNIAVDLVD